VVHGIVKGYEGNIGVKSVLGKGTVFTVYLPVSKGEAALYGEPSLEDLPGGNEKILFVDDEKAVAEMGSRHLRKLGYSVTTRNDSLAALDLFKSNPDLFDLIITDMTMPLMSGDKLARALMKIRKDIPVILCTGYSKRISTTSIRGIGVKTLIMKPFQKRDLAETVRRVLDTRSQKT
jgi:CheY-like chemotaxis protein